MLAKKRSFKDKKPLLTYNQNQKGLYRWCFTNIQGAGMIF